MILFQCVIPGRCYVKKNGAKVYRGRRVLTKNYIAWESTALMHLERGAIEARRGQKSIFPISEYVGLSLTFFFENHQSESDVSNLIEGPQDALQKIGIISDDKLFKEVRASKHFAKSPGTVIRIYSLEDKDENASIKSIRLGETET